MKKLIAALLALAMAVTFVPTVALAANKTVASVNRPGPFFVRPGVKPIMPETVEVTLSDRSKVNLSVDWDEIPETLYGGSYEHFTVNGSLTGYTMQYSGSKATVYVDVYVVTDEKMNADLVLYYSFDNDWAEPTSIYDDSGNGYNGEILNNSQRIGGWQSKTVEKKITVEDGAAVFPGAENAANGNRTTFVNGAAIRIPEAVKSRLPEDYTVSMWVKTDSSYEFYNKKQRFFDFGTGTTDSIFLRYIMTEDGGQLRFQDRSLGSDQNDINSYIASTEQGVNLNDKWALLTVTFDKSENATTVYVNGKKAASNTGKFKRGIGDIGTLTDSAFGMFLGRTMWYQDNGEKPNNPEYKGLMDDVRIYNRALEENDVLCLYSLTNPETDKTVAEIEPLEDVYTLRNKQPSLPRRAKVTYTDATSGYVDINWETVKEGLDKVGDLTARGKLADSSAMAVTVTVHVVTDPKLTVGSGMAANYTFENDGEKPSVIKDMSGNGNDATVRNTHFEDRIIRADRELTVEDGAAVFPGSGQVEYFWGDPIMINGAALQLPNDFNRGIYSYTVSMWVKADSDYIYGDKYQRLFDFGNVSGDLDDSIYAAYYVNSRKFSFWDYRDYYRKGCDIDRLDEDYSLTDKWGMVTVTYNSDAKQAVVYINGAEKGRVYDMPRGLSDLGSLNDGSNGLYIGRNVWSSAVLEDNPDFKGRMDNIRIYDRPLESSEVQALYEVSNPQRKIPVTKKIVFKSADGTVVNTVTEEDEAAEFGRYSVTPEPTRTYNGTVYSLSKAQSKLVIDRVTEEDCTVEIVYAILTVASVEEARVETYHGVEPQLPTEVTVTYQTGDTDVKAVSWESVPASKYADVGEFTVSGTVEGAAAVARVTVFKVDKVELSDIVYTPMGETPSLPQTARVTFSHKAESSILRVSWDELPSDKVESSQDFEHTGRLTDYPDVTVSVKVRFIYEAAFDEAAVADTYTSNESGGNGNYGDGDLRVTYNGGAGRAEYNRYTFLRFPGSDIDGVLDAKVRLFVQNIDNWAYTTYTLYAIDEEYGDWDEYSLTWNTQDEIIGHSTEIASAGLDATLKNVWLEFDVYDYIKSAPGRKYYSFYVSSDTCATYIYSREHGENPPTMSYIVEGQPVTVNYVSGGRTLLTETVTAPKNQTFTYEDRKNILVQDGGVYVYRSGAYIEKVDGSHDVMTLTMDETKDYEFDDITVSSYYDSVPDFPEQALLSAGGHSIALPVTFEKAVPGKVGFSTVYGEAEGLKVPANIKAYGRYYSEDGETLGYASLVTVEYRAADGVYEADPVEMEVQTGSTLSSATVSEYYPQLRNAQFVGGQITEPVQTVIVTGDLYEGVSARAEAYLEGQDSANYTVRIEAVAANTAAEAGEIAVIAARYDQNGRLDSVSTKKASLNGSMTNRKELEYSVNYDRDRGEDLRIYVWELAQGRPLSAPILAANLYGHGILELMPDYDSIKENVLRANNYYQSHNSANNRTFWDIAAYHTGNMETYFTFGGENYLDYSFDWANSRNWMGNKRTDLNKDQWTWNYPAGDSDSTTDVLFGDWQICFQSFLDMYLIDSERANISRVDEVMSYQITKGNDNFWYWADALYMVPPIMTKMYLNTGDITYIDKLYDYYRFSAELMYDGDCGIPNKGASDTEKGENYTTSAENNKNRSSYFSDPENYANLFYRDANYVYPLNANSGHADEKNFWSRGNGWVFAGLAKILTDIPENHESYPYFVNLYKEMAAAIIDCQRQDDQGRGFWTQSMLQNYPRGENGNTWGYETSGTAFFTYGLFWGLNSGMLDEGTYLEPALRAWKYLSEVALQSDGKVGYCQQIGSNVAQATEDWREQPFGYGAFLLAGCEASRFVGGVTADNETYLKRRLWNAVAFTDGKVYNDGEASYSTAYVENGDLYLPVVTTAKYFGFSTAVSGGGYRLTDDVNGGSGQLNDTVKKDSVPYATADALAEAMGLYATRWGDVTVISHKKTVFYDCESEAVNCLNDVMAR